MLHFLSHIYLLVDFVSKLYIVTTEISFITCKKNFKKSTTMTGLNTIISRILGSLFCIKKKFRVVVLNKDLLNVMLSIKYNILLIYNDKSNE